MLASLASRPLAPSFSGGSASALPVSRPAQRSHLRPADSLSRLKRPFDIGVLSPYRCLYEPLRLLPAGPVAGWDSQRNSAFPRRTEKCGLELTWKRVDLGRGLLWVEFTKDELREIPLSKYATRYLAGLVRYLNIPYVFVNSRTGTRWVTPDKPLRRAAERVGLKVGFHDLRRFRCSQWLMQGVDVRTVQKLMGHSAISTTMRYAGYVSSHALASIREAQANEDSQMRPETNRQRIGKTGNDKRGTSG